MSQPRRIIVVDDSMMNRMAVVEMLNEHDVMEAAGPEEVLSLIQDADDKVDFVVYNAGVAEDAGKALVEAIKSESDGAAISFVALVPQDGPLTEEDAKRAGADFVLERPFDVNDLLCLVNKEA